MNKNEKKTPLVLRKDVVMSVSIVFGAIMGGLLSAIGQNTGEYHGRKDMNELWKTSIDSVLKETGKEPEKEGD